MYIYTFIQIHIANTAISNLSVYMHTDIHIKILINISNYNTLKSGEFIMNVSCIIEEWQHSLSDFAHDIIAARGKVWTQIQSRTLNPMFFHHGVAPV